MYLPQGFHAPPDTASSLEFLGFLLIKSKLASLRLASRQDNESKNLKLRSLL